MDTSVNTVNVEIADLQHRAAEGDEYRFGPFRLIVSGRLLLRKDKPVELGGRALDVLIALVERAGEVVSHRELLERVWVGVTIEESGLRVHIAALRRALGDGRDGARYITNVPSRGYCFVASVERPAESNPFAATRGGRVKAPMLPARLQRLVGRDETIEVLRAEIVSRRFVSIVGPGGVGKTTVAIAVAHEMASDFHDAVYLIDFSAIRDDALVVSVVASAVGCLELVQDSLPRLLAFLADKRVLLVLDSCEHVVESVAILTEQLFREASQVHIIATTREALRVEGENVHPLEPLQSPRADSKLTAREALTFPAVQLFMDRAAAGGYRKVLTDDEAPVVATSCQQLDGIPLAIELTASRASNYGISGLTQLIGDHLILLWRGRRGLARHQTLQAMLDWSYNTLSECEKAVLCRLSVFVGAFTLEMAQSVVSDEDQDGLLVANAIGSLIDKSLISVSQMEGAGCYRILDTTRAYAAIKLQEREEANVIARRHALHYAGCLAGIRDDSLQYRDIIAYARHMGDSRSALEWSFSASGDTSVAVELGAGAVPVFLGLSMLKECRRWCLQTLDALSEQQRGTKLELGLQLSLAISSTYVHGNSDEARNALERGLSLSESFGDARYQLEFLAGLNLYRARLADFGGSLEAAERYAATAREFGGPRETVMADWMLGASYHLVGNQAAAQHCYQRGFQRAAADGASDKYSFGYDHQVRALIGYARTLWLRGLPDQAAHFAYWGIEIAGTQEHPVTLCVSLLYATQVFLWRGDQKVAEDLTERLVACAARYSLVPYLAGGMGLRGEPTLARGETKLGVELLRNALPTLHTNNQYIMSSSFSRALAEGLARLGSSAEATDIIDAVVSKAKRGPGTFELPDLLRARAAVLLDASPANWPAAEASLKDSIDCARRQSALGWELRSAIALGLLWTDHGRGDEARALLADVCGRFTEGFETADLIEAKRLLDRLAGEPRATGVCCRFRR